MSFMKYSGAVPYLLSQQGKNDAPISAFPPPARDPNAPISSGKDEPKVEKTATPAKPPEAPKVPIIGQDKLGVT